MVKKIITREELILELKIALKKYGSLTLKDVAELSKKKELHSVSSYRKEFGSWKKALEEVGATFKERAKKGKTVVEKEALEMLRKYCEENGVPSSKEVEKLSKRKILPSLMYYHYTFGSWEKTLDLIGLLPKKKNNELVKLTNEELIEYLKKCDYNSIKKNHQFLIYKFKKPLYQIMKMVGREKEVKIKYLNREDYINLMKKESKALSLEEFFKKNNISMRETFLKEFGSWNNFLKICGYDINREWIKVDKTDEELIEEFRKASIEKGYYLRGLPTELFKKELGYTGTFIGYRFGSIRRFKILAGFQPRKEKNNNWTKEMIVDELLKMEGKITKKSVINNKSLPNPTTVLRHFKTSSWKSVLEELEKIKNSKIKI